MGERLMGLKTLAIGLLALLVSSGCATGAVVIAPTPLPPDLSPLPYEHPSGAFSISVPRNWSIHVQNSTTLASASFSPPGYDQPLLTVAVVNTDAPIVVTELSDLVDDYQSIYRPDLARYIESDRQAMGDGSWRVTGVRGLPGGIVEPVNTFIEANGTFVGVLDVTMSNNSALQTDLQTAINTFAINPTAELTPTDLATLGLARPTALQVVSVRAWSNEGGVFFVTGEVANTGGGALAPVPIQVSLLSQDGAILAQAMDTTMGHGLPAGGFAPFSLRFGAGQPSDAVDFIVTIGEGESWSPEERMIFSGGALTWTDDSTFLDNGDLFVTGNVTNEGGNMIVNPVAIVTVFDVDQAVVGAWFVPLGVDRLAPGADAPFEIRVEEIGGEPANYIVEIQGLPETG